RRRRPAARPAPRQLVGLLARGPCAVVLPGHPPVHRGAQGNGVRLHTVRGVGGAEPLDDRLLGLESRLLPATGRLLGVVLVHGDLLGARPAGRVLTWSVSRPPPYLHPGRRPRVPPTPRAAGTARATARRRPHPG